MEFIFIHIQLAAIGDYFFLILIILASVIQAFSQKRKAEIKKVERRKSLERELEEVDNEEEEWKDIPGKSIFDQMEKMFIPELAEEQQDGKPVIISEVENEFNQKQPALISNITEEELNKELVKDHSSIHLTPTKKKSARIKSHILKGFTLKKAVVYSEILNRKEY